MSNTQERKIGKYLKLPIELLQLMKMRKEQRSEAKRIGNNSTTKTSDQVVNTNPDLS